MFGSQWSSEHHQIAHALARIQSVKRCIDVI
jgi:hypothetical protein